MAEKDTEMATDKNYEILAQIYSILHDKMGQKGIAMEKVLEKDFDVNYSVPSSKCSLSKIVGRTALDFALDKRELEVFQMLIRHGADFTSKNQSGSTILHRTIEKSFVNKKPCHELKGILEHPFVQSVLSAHIEMKKVANPCNQHGISHFHIACMFNHVEAVQFFLAQGFSVNQAIDLDSKIFPGYTPLHLAARYSAFETAKFLLDHDADVNLRDAEGMYPLILLIKRNNEISDWENVRKRNLCGKLKKELLNNEKLIGILLEKSKINEMGLSRCHVACTLSGTQMLEQIMTEGVSLKDLVDKDSPFASGYSPLHFAAIFNIDAVKLLLANGADIMSKDANGVTAFDLCLQRYSPETIHSIVSMVPELNKITFNETKIKLADLILSMAEEATLRSFLQESAKNVNMSLPFDSPIWPGYTILHIAVILSDRNHDIKDLYEDTDYKLDDRERLAYKYHEEKEYFRRVELCLTMGADVTITDISNSTPLHLAFRLQNRHIVKLLLSYHHKVTNVVDSDNLSHLHIACTVYLCDLVEKLLQTGVDVNQPIKSNLKYRCSSNREELLDVLHINPGWTCLHIAVMTSNEELVRVLMKYGADLLAKDSHEVTPIHQFLYTDCPNSGYEVLSSKHYGEQVTDFGLSHLHVACFVGDDEAVVNLIEQEADIEAKLNYNLIRSNPAFPRLAPFDGYTPLHFALKGHHTSTVKLLIQLGVDLFSKSASGCILFYEALKSPFEMIDYENMDDEVSCASSDDFNEKNQNDCEANDDDDEEENDAWNDDDESESMFVLELISDKRIEDIIKKDSGITKLHIACLGLRRKMVIKLLKKGADPNLQIHGDSPIWPGFTPLHILMIPRFTNDHDRQYLSYVYKKIAKIGKSLLSHGACVTLKDAEGNTPIHKAPAYLWSDSNVNDSHGLNLIGWILDGYKDFNVNPVDAFGISHFDVACMSDHDQVVEKFMKHGVDVNRRFGHFSKYYGGFTALHLASLYKNDATVDWLLENSANCHANDFLGNTPFHTAAVYCRLGNNGYRPYNEYVYETLLKAGADLEAKNLWNETPLGVILRMKMITHNTILTFLERNTCRVNIFNLENDEGFLGVALQFRRRSHDIENDEYYRAVVKNRKSNDVDEMGRTVIHNVVSVKEPVYSHLEEYTRIIRGFIHLDVDIDCQDSKGETALHKAIRFSNYHAIVGLLNNGADINIVDSCNKPAFAYCIENKEQNEDITRRNILKACLLHVHKLQMAGLEVSKANQNLVAQIRKESISCNRKRQRCAQELETLKKHAIDKSYSITMYNFLSETMNYFRMMVFLRDVIEPLFDMNNEFLLKTFPEFAGLLQMQYRNVFVRLQLIDPAKSALNFLTGSALPDLCSEQITKSLSNRDLKQLIAASETQ